MVGANISPEQLLSIAERNNLEADEDKDDLISFEEFAKMLERTDVEQNPLKNIRSMLQPNHYAAGQKNKAQLTFAKDTRQDSDGS